MSSSVQIVWIAIICSCARACVCGCVRVCSHWACCVNCHIVYVNVGVMQVTISADVGIRLHVSMCLCVLVFIRMCACCVSSCLFVCTETCPCLWLNRDTQRWRGRCHRALQSFCRVLLCSWCCWMFHLLMWQRTWWLASQYLRIWHGLCVCVCVSVFLFSLFSTTLVDPCASPVMW